MQEDRRRRGKVKKGWLAVRVGALGGDEGEAEDEGAGGGQRFLIPITYLYHPQFRKLLEAAREAFGYRSAGPLRLPCSVDDFLRLRWIIERDAAAEQRGRPRHHRR